MTLDVGVHDGIDEAIYHADPCPEPSLSASLAQVLLGQSALHAWTKHPRLNPNFRPDHDEAMDKGTAAHTMLLGRGKTIATVDAPDWRTKAARAERDHARALRLVPVLANDYADAAAMAHVVSDALANTPGCSSAFLVGEPERVLVWKEKCGIYCRAMLDWHSPKGDLWDYKTGRSSANPLAAGARASDMGWDLKQAFYVRGLRALGLPFRSMRFVCQENYPPYAVSVIELDKELVDLGERVAERAILTFANCLKTGHWPSYAPIIHRVTAPPWAMNRHIEREVFDQVATDQMREFAEKAQEPL